METFAEKRYERKRAMKGDSGQECLPGFKEEKCKFCGKPLEVTKMRLPFGDKPESTITLPCECVLDQRKKQEEKNQRHSRLKILHGRGFGSGKYAFMTFKNWREGNVDASVLEAVTEYRKSVGLSGRNWLYMHGGHGVGKSHLSVALARAISLDRGWSTAIFPWTQYCGQIQQSWNDKEVVVDRPLIKDSTLIVLDDIDKKAGHQWALSELYDVIDQRYLKNLPTVITANRSIKELSSYWSKEQEDLCRAIISRIMGQLIKIIHIKGADYRLMAS